MAQKTPIQWADGTVTGTSGRRICGCERCPGCRWYLVACAKLACKEKDGDSRRAMDGQVDAPHAPSPRDR